jgi:hypothetical protein
MIKKSLNPTLIYILSIVGLLCCCFGGVGILFSLPAFIIANRKEKDAKDFPDDYEGDVKAMNTAKIVALIVLILNALMILQLIYTISTGEFDKNLELFKEAIEEGMRQQQNQ